MKQPESGSFVPGAIKPNPPGSKHASAAISPAGLRLAAALRSRRPLVHCLTNAVSINDVANALLAVGASPIMAVDACETAEVTARADALLINLGMPGPDKLEAMLLSGRAARKSGILVVFDPVGVSLTAFRRAAAERILTELRPDIIRGNFSEISFLAGQAASARGVDDGDDGTLGKAERLSQSILRAEAVSRKYGAVTVLTGERNVVTDGQYTEIQSGSSIWLTRMTGAGCILSALTAVYAAVARKGQSLEPIATAEDGKANPSDMVVAAVSALERFRHAANQAERRIEETGGGSGSFRVFLIDALGSDLAAGTAAGRDVPAGDVAGLDAAGGRK